MTLLCLYYHFWCGGKHDHALYHQEYPSMHYLGSFKTHEQWYTTTWFLNNLLLAWEHGGKLLTLFCRPSGGYFSLSHWHPYFIWSLETVIFATTFLLCVCLFFCWHLCVYRICASVHFMCMQVQRCTCPQNIWWGQWLSLILYLVLNIRCFLLFTVVYSRLPGPGILLSQFYIFL